MTLLGFDPRDSGTLVAFVDENGQLLSQSTQNLNTSALAEAVMHEGRRAEHVGMVLRDGSVGAVAKGVVAVNPGAAIALAEQWSGAAKGARNVVGLNIGSAVHAGMIVDGKLFGGSHGLAGAVAWLALNPVEREDYRKLGCLEAEVGGQGIVRRLVWRIKAGDESQVLEMVKGNLSAVTAQLVFDAARAGDGVAISVVRDTARYVGMAVANLITILDPEVVVLGGSIAEASDLFLEPTRVETSRRILPAANPQVQVVTAALGDASAAIGAARAALLAAK